MNTSLIARESPHLERLPLTLAMCFGLLLLLLPLAHLRAAQSVMVGVSLLLFVICVARGPRALRCVLAPEIAWPLAAWTLIGTASCLWSQFPLRSLDLVAQTVWMPGAFFFAAIWAGNNPISRRWATRGLSAGLFLLCVTGIGTLALGRLDVLQTGSAPDLATHPLMRWYPGPGLASTFALLALPVLYWMLKERLQARSLLIALGACLIAIGASSVNRMFWPCVLVAALAIAMSYESNRERFLRRGKGVILGALVIVSGIVFVLVVTAVRHGQSITSAGIAEAAHVVAQDPRFSIWQKWFAAGEQHALLGTGYGKEVAQDTYATELSRYSSAEMDLAGRTHPHNVLISIWIQTGIPGLACFVFLFASLLRYFWRMGRQSPATAHVAAAAFALICVMLAKNMTDDFYDRIVTIMFWSFLGLMLGYASWIQSAAKTQ